VCVVGGYRHQPTSRNRHITEACFMRAILSRALGCQQRNASTLGSHLLAATVRATLEVLLTDAPAHVSRQHDSQAD
jgi:hypothetical protein